MFLFFCTLYSQNKKPLPLLITEENSFKQKTRPPVKVKADSLWVPSWAAFLELGGKGFYSFNLDYRRKPEWSASAGIQFIEGGIFPSMMYYRFYGQRKRLETGIGTSIIMAPGDSLFRGMMVHGVIGYRYQKINGFFFRIGFTPLLGIPFYDLGGSVTLIPFAGVSLGYSF